MACQTLLRRRTQLALLERVCRERLRARLSLRRNVGDAVDVRLAALERDGVLLRWSRKRIADAEIEGQPVEVRFEHEGVHYVFCAVSRGRVQRQLGRAEPGTLLKLSIPLRLETTRRQHPRLTFENLPPITSTFTHVIDDRRQFRARMVNIADGGVGVLAKAADVSRLFTGDLFWVDVELPGAKTRSEFVVRLVHLRPVKNSDEVALGWAFQPMDDTASYEKCLRRLETFVAREQPPQSVQGAD